MREMENVLGALEAQHPKPEAPADAARHVLRLLGEPVWTEGTATHPVASKKGLAILCYLACQPRVEISRRHLGSLLWGEFDKSQASSSLATTLSRIRRQVPCWPLASQGEYLWWDPSQGVATDVSWFVTRQGSDAPQEPRAALVRGRFLAGLAFDDAPLFMDWLVAERQEWHRRSLDELWAASLAARSRSAWRDVLRWGRQALALDPLQERFVRTVMVAHAALGDRASCRDAYDALAVRLARQLDTRPDPDTLRLRDSLLRSPPAPAGRFGTVYSPGGAPDPGEVVPLVGRQEEQRRLQDMVGTLGHRMVTVVVGPMGVGKTRLLREGLAGMDTVWADGRLAAGSVGDQFPWQVWEQALQIPDPVLMDHPRASWRTLVASVPEGRQPVLVLDHAEALSPMQAAHLGQAVGEGAPEQLRMVVAVDAAGLDPTLRREWRFTLGAAVSVLQLGPLPEEEVARLGDLAATGPPLANLVSRTGGLPLLVLAEVGGTAERVRARDRVAEWLVNGPSPIRAVLEAAAAVPGVPVDRLWGCGPAMLDAIDDVLAAGWLLEAAEGRSVRLQWAAPALGDLIREGMSLSRVAYWRAQLSPRPEHS